MSEQQKPASTEAEVIRDLAVASTAPVSMALATQDQTIPYAIVPAGAELVALESLMGVPHRKRGTVILDDAASFIEVCMAEGGAQSRLYLSLGDKPCAVAVFNEGVGDSAGWADHRAIYTCPVSVEWKRWMGSNGKTMDQVAFATFIEDNVLDIQAVSNLNGSMTPSSADMLEISRTLEAKKKVNFASGVRLDNGAIDFSYEEQIDGTAGKGKLQVPSTFTLGIPVLAGGQSYRVNCRFRYRISDGGKLIMWYDIERPHKFIEDAVNDEFTTIKVATGMLALRGTAPVAITPVR